MSHRPQFTQFYSPLIAILAVLMGMFSHPAAAHAHPLGNFTINHFSRLHLDAHHVTVQYVVDMAEIPAFQALQVADEDGDHTTSKTELQAYLTQITPPYVEGLALQIDRQPIPLALQTQTISLPPGAGGLATMRLEWSLTGTIPPAPTQVRELDFADHNDRTRIGWREIVIDPTAALPIFNSSAYSDSLTDALRAYPEDLLTTPLQESVAHLAFSQGAVPVGATPLRTRAGQVLPPRRTFLTTLAEWKTLLFSNNYANNYQRLPLMPPLNGSTVGGMAMAIGAAFIWGALHSMTPGHGKTLVGAYLVGTKATPQHALLLALTTTITHTIGVFALGFITLFAAAYVLPEQLYPWLSLGSGVMVVAIGGNLLTQRWRSLRLPLAAAMPTAAPTENALAPHEHAPDHDQGHVHDHSHQHHDHHEHNHSHSHDQGKIDPKTAMVSLAIAAPNQIQLNTDNAHHHPHDHNLAAIHQHDHDSIVIAGHHHDQVLEHHSNPHHHVLHQDADTAPFRLDHMPDDAQNHNHNHDHNHNHIHAHNHAHNHSHGPSSHTHLPGADGVPVTWQSLLALGISGGLMPCPAALVLLLGAIAIGQVRFGLILVFVFSLGLAGVLTGLGLLLVYAKHLFKAVPVSLQWVRGLPALGAFGITIVGLSISTRALLTLSGGS
jgi:nickel/cobalt transporter (NicO) family protein